MCRYKKLGNAERKGQKKTANVCFKKVEITTKDRKLSSIAFFGRRIVSNRDFFRIADRIARFVA